MRMDSEMIGILLSDSMHYTIVVSLEMSDEPYILLVVVVTYLPPPKRLINYLTFNLEHNFTTVKAKKIFLRGDNLKIC